MINPISRRAFALAAAAALAGCGQSATEGNQAHDGAAHHEANPAHAPSGAGMKMHDAMALAVGADISDTWVRKMIEHHEGAVAMAEAAAAESRDPRVAALARRMAAQQRQEIEEMRRLVRRDAAPDPASARPYLAVEKQMHDGMMAATGADAAETFLRQMIPHHQGAVDMSRIVLAQGRDERVAALARRIVADQEKEIAEMRAMLEPAATGAPAGPSGSAGNAQD